MSRIDVWNKSIKKVGIRVASESELNLMLMKPTKLQKITREGVKIKVRGENIWFYDTQETVKHLGEKVFVRYDPTDLSSVRIYDENDRYLYTWQNTDFLLVDYIETTKQRVADGEKVQRTVEKFIKQQAEGVTAGLTNEQRISMIDMTVRRANQNISNFKIEKPTKIIPITANEPLPKVSGGEDISVDAVIINLDKIAINGMKRKR